MIPHDWIKFGLYTFAFFISGVLAVLRVGYLLGQYEKKLDDRITRVYQELQRDYKKSIYSVDKEQNDKRDSLEKGLDEKRARMYERFDGYKKHIESEFVRTSMCTVLHQHSSKEMSDMREQIGALSIKIDELKNIILSSKANAQN